jgi:hypothetical protein
MFFDSCLRCCPHRRPRWWSAAFPAASVPVDDPLVGLDASALGVGVEGLAEAVQRMLRVSGSPFPAPAGVGHS